MTRSQKHTCINISRLLWLTCEAPSSSPVTLSRPLTSSLLRTTHCSLGCASPCLWNQLWNQFSASLHQPHSRLSISDSSLPTPVTSSCSFDSPLSSSITPSFFHSRLKTYQFHKSFALYTLFITQDWLHGTDFLSYIGLWWSLFATRVYVFSSFPYFFCFYFGSLR